MAIADRYEGQFAGTCGCGASLVWDRDDDGNWITTHGIQEGKLFCDYAEPKPAGTDSGVQPVG